jgi:hypothetical protein
LQQIGSSDNLPVLLHDRRIVSVFEPLASSAHALATVAVMLTVARVDYFNDLQHSHRGPFARCSATD